MKFTFRLLPACLAGVVALTTQYAAPPAQKSADVQVVGASMTHARQAVHDAKALVADTLSPHRPTVCRGRDLLVSHGRSREPASQQLVREFQLTNLGTQACRLRGYPSGALLNRHGKRVVPLTQGGGAQLEHGKPRNVRLAPGWSAYFGINSTRCQSEERLSTKVALRFPGQHRSHRTRIPPIFFCTRPDDPGSVVHVSPIRSSLDAVFLP